MFDFVFIVQARTGSSRLPGKMIRLFYEDLTIPEIIIQRLKQYFPDIPVILATSENEGDTVLVDHLRGKVDYIVRGSEENVLSRFIDAEKLLKAKALVRICADNPFIDVGILGDLLSRWKSNYDYLANSVKGVPSMKTSYGFFCEITTFNALRSVAKSTDNPFYFEHVTNYIYENPQIFNVKFVESDELIAASSDIRLTVDTAADFLNAATVYKTMVENKLEINYKNVLKTTEKSNLLGSMKKENELNAK